MPADVIRVYFHFHYETLKSLRNVTSISQCEFIKVIMTFSPVSHKSTKMKYALLYQATYKLFICVVTIWYSKYSLMSWICCIS